MSALVNPLRPSGLGELLDRAVGFWRAHWKALYQLVIGFQLVEYIFVALAQGLSRWLFPLARDPSALQSAPAAAFPQLMGSIAVLVVAVLLSLFVAQVAGVATTWFSYARLTGRGLPTAGDAFRHAAARLGTTAGVYTLSMVWSVVVMLLLLVPGSVLGAIAVYLVANDARAAGVVLLVLAGLALAVGSVVLVLWFVIRFILVSQIIAVEKLGALGVFRRANALSSGRVEAGALGLVKLRLTVLVTIMGGILLVVSLVTSLPVLLTGAAFGAGFTPGHAIDDVVPALILLPLQLVQTMLGGLVAPLFVVFQVFFYADMRTRREGLDLELALGAPAP